MFPKPKSAKPSKPSQPETMSVTCEACDCTFNIPNDLREPPECPACGETLQKVARS